MNKRYRKQMRLKRRHQHTPWCRCPEMSFFLAVKTIVTHKFGGDYKAFWDSLPVRKLPPRKER